MASYKLHVRYYQDREKTGLDNRQDDKIELDSSWAAIERAQSLFAQDHVSGVQMTLEK